MHLLRSQKEWQDVGPQDRMGAYNALKDPHLRQLHGGRRSRAHLRKMKDMETQSKENLEAAAKLAWRRDVHKMYGGVNVYKRGRSAGASASRSATPGGRGRASAASSRHGDDSAGSSKAKRSPAQDTTPSTVASSYPNGDEDEDHGHGDDVSPSVISDRFGDTPVPRDEEEKKGRGRSRTPSSRSRSRSRSPSSGTYSSRAADDDAPPGDAGPAAGAEDDKQPRGRSNSRSSSSSSSYRSDAGGDASASPTPAKNDEARPEPEPEPEADARAKEKQPAEDDDYEEDDAEAKRKAAAEAEASQDPPLPRGDTEQSDDYGDDFDTYKEGTTTQGKKDEAEVYTQPLEGLDLDAWIPKIRELLAPDYNTKVINKPVKIAQSLYLGNHKAAKNIKLLEDNGIASIFNCAPEQCRTSHETYADTDFKYYEIIALDAPDYPLLDRHLGEAIQALRAARDGGFNLLIHCFQGVNRSASLVVAALMAVDGTTLQDTLAVAHAARPVVLQGNDGFLGQLITYAYKHGLLKED